MENYVARFEMLGFGMIVHFGLYSILGKGEWYLALNDKADKAKYESLTSKFVVSKSWAKELVKTAKESGCKYITLTARHHDGFSLYDTKGLSDFDVMHSACGRDLIKEFVVQGWSVKVWLISSDGTEESTSTKTFTFDQTTGDSFEVDWTNCGDVSSKTLRGYATATDTHWMQSERYNNQIYIPGVWNNSDTSHVVNPGLANGVLKANAVLNGTNQDEMTITTTLSFSQQAAGSPVFRVMLLGKALEDTLITDSEGNEISLKGQYITLAAQERTITATEETVTFADLPGDVLSAFEDWRVVVVPASGSGL